MNARESLDPDRSLWHLIAVELHRHREQHRLSESKLGVILDCDRSTVSRYESGGLKLPEKRAKILDRLWHTEGLFTRLVRFARAGNDGDWFVGLTEYEARATRIKMWELALVPGLLQTVEYARAVYRAGLSDDAERDVQRRMARQAAVFERERIPNVSVILNWAALAQPIGGNQVMHDQLARLLEVSELPNVSVRVLEREVGEHCGLDGSFKLLTVEDKDIAYAEAVHQGALLLDPPDVQGVAIRWDRIGDLAAPVGPSRAVIERAMESYV